MKKDSLLMPAVIGSAALLICIIVLFIAWAVGLESKPEHPLRWFARDFGTLIAAGAALLAAFVTVRKMQQQIDQTRVENDRLAVSHYVADVRSDCQAVRATLLEFLAHSVSYVRLARALKESVHLSDVEKATYKKENANEPNMDAALKTYASKKRVDEFIRHTEHSKQIPPVPEMKTGFLPREIRKLANVSLLRLQGDIQKIEDRRLGAVHLELNFEKTLETWAKTELFVIRMLIVVEAKLKEFERNHAFDADDLSTELDIEEICRDEEFHLVYPKILEKFQIEVNWKKDQREFFDRIPHTPPLIALGTEADGVVGL